MGVFQCEDGGGGTDPCVDLVVTELTDDWTGDCGLCPEPIIVSGPFDVTVNEGGFWFFEVSHTGTSTQWQRSIDGGATWANVSGSLTSIGGASATAAQDGYQYRAIVTNDCGTVTSPAATLNVTVVVNCDISFTAQPNSPTITECGQATLTASWVSDIAPVSWVLEYFNPTAPGWQQEAAGTETGTTSSWSYTDSFDETRRWRIRINNGCLASQSDEGLVTVIPVTGTLSCPPATATFPGQVTIGFAATSTVTEIALEFSENGGISWFPSGQLSGGVSSVSYSQALPAVTAILYRFKITTLCGRVFYSNNCFVDITNIN